jgi:hypothetical protein
MRLTGVNQQNIRRLAQLPSIHAHLAVAGEEIAMAARARAPHRTGHYAASIQSRPLNTRAARTRVYARDFKWVWIEYGAGPSPVRKGRPFPAKHPMEFAVRAVGLRWDDRYAGE